jgi:formate dehydrogenase subunit gamma
VSTTTAGTRPTWSDDRAREITSGLAAEPGPLLDVLHAIQAEFGYVDPRAVPVVADVLNLSRAEVHGVISFYTDFRTTPPPATTVQLCRGEACQAVGAEALVAHARQRLGVEVGGQTADGAVGLEQVFCFGNCALGPTVAVAGRLHGRVTPDTLDGLLDDTRPATPEAGS